MIYFALYALLIFLLLMLANDHRKVALLVLLSIIAYWGFSLVAAVDISGYMFSFDCMNTHGDPRESFYRVYEGSYGEFEYGFLLAMQLSKRIVPYFEFFQLFLFSIEVLLVYLGIKRLDLEDKFSATIMMCMMAFSLSFSLLGAMRQGVAIALFIYSLPFFMEKKYLKCVVCIVLGSFFHSSSILLLVVFVLCWLFDKHRDFFFSRAFLWSLFILCNVFYAFHLSVGNVFGGFLSTFSSSYSDYYESFLNESNYGYMKLLEMDGCFIIAFFTSFMKRSNKYFLLAPIFILYFVVNTISGGIAVHRISYYFAIPYAVFLVESLLSLLQNIGIKSGISLAIVFVYLFITFAYQNSMFGNYPYDYYIRHFM